MSGYRRAAVALHGLGKGDQEWILAQLHDSARQQLTKHLTELNDLGFVDEAFSLLNILPEHATSDDSDLAVLCRAGATEIFSILKNEPPSLIGRLLAMQDWPWANSMLQMFHPSHQDRIRSFMRQGNPTPPALKIFLVTTIAEKLKSGRMDAKKSRPSEARSILQRISAGFSLSFSSMVKSWSR